MQTSYFANLKNLSAPAVAICGKSPDWFTGPQYKKLAPKWSFFKDYKDGQINATEYTKLYQELVLSNLNPHNVFEELKALSDGSCELVLLCYEKPGDFCHRHLVAEWISSNCGIAVTEAPTNKEPTEC